MPETDERRVDAPVPEDARTSAQTGGNGRNGGGPPVRHDGGEGFGTVLGQATVRGQLGGEISWDWNPVGVTIRLRMARDRLDG